MNENSSPADADRIPWPPHKVSMHIDHNLHLGYYETVQEALDQRTYDPDNFPDEAEIAKSIATGEVWTIQWYPDTPVGFNRVSAATLSRALSHALEVANEP